MLPVTYNLSLIPSATDPHPANTTTIPSRLVCKEQKTKTKKLKTHKRKILAIRSLTRSLQLSRSWLLREGTHTITHFYKDIADTRLIWPRGRFSECKAFPQSYQSALHPMVIKMFKSWYSCFSDNSLF